MSRYKYPPKITRQTVEYEQVKGLLAPPPHVGYTKDRRNPWVQHSEWNPCRYRRVEPSPKTCGRALLTHTCHCPGHRMCGQSVKPDACDFCDSAEPDQRVL